MTKTNRRNTKKSFSGWKPSSIVKGDKNSAVSGASCDRIKLQVKVNKSSHKKNDNEVIPLDIKSPSMSTSSHRHRNQHIHRNLNYHPRHSPSNNRNDQRKKKRKIGTRSPNRDTNLSQQDTDKPKVVVVTLPWHRNDCHSIFPVPLKTEQSLLTVLLRTDCRDRGMMRDCPPQVLKRIRKACKSSGVNLTQALSLRRHHIVLRNPNAPSMSHLGLGNIRDVQKSATLFEDALENYMRTFPNISFCTEQQQRNDFFQKVKKLKQEGRQKQGRGVPPRLPPTPDFLFNSPVRLSNPTNANDKAYSNVNVNDKIGADFVAHWIDAKMFYGKLRKYYFIIASPQKVKYI